MLSWRILLSSLIVLTTLTTQGQTVSGQDSDTAASLYQEAFYLEQGEGDLEAAIRLYEEIADRFPEDRRTSSRALYRLGLCYEFIGRDKAIESFVRLIENYGDQRDLVQKAREKLRELEDAVDEGRADFGALHIMELKRPDGMSVWDTEAALSPDGSRLVYWDGENDLSLVLVDRNRGITTRLASQLFGDGDGSWHYRWSPDGETLCFDLGNFSQKALALYELESQEFRVLLREEGVQLTPIEWSSDGLSLLTHRKKEDDPGQIVLVDRSGGLIPLVQVPEGVEPLSFRLSPDGAHFVYSSFGENGEVLLYSIGSGETQKATNHPSRDYSPLWSPDGRSFIFLSDRLGSTDLWMMAFSDGKVDVPPQLVTKDLGSEAKLKSWTKKERLTFARPSRLRDIWALPLEEGTATPSGEPFLSTTVQGRNVQPAASPDGRWVAFMTWEDEDQKLGISAIEGSEEFYFEDLPSTVYNPFWKDGEIVALIAQDETGGFLLECDLGSRTVRKGLEAPLRESGEGDSGWIRHWPRPDVSAEGRILLELFEPMTSNAGLYILDRALLSKIPGTEKAALGRWIPGADSVVSLELYENRPGLFRIESEEGQKEPLFLAEEGEGIQTFGVSPDGRYLAFPHFQKGPSRHEFWSLKVLELETRQVSTLDLPRGLNPWWVDWAGDGRHIVFGSLRIMSGVFLLENFWPDDLTQ